MPDNAPRQLLGVNPALITPPIGAEGIIGFEVTALGNALLVSISGAPIVVNVNLDLADDEVAIGGPDSGGTRRLFQGRVSGANNIQEMVPVLIGGQALALGKAEDTVAASGDVGVMALVIRRDADAPDAADGDYVGLHTDAVGRLKVAATGGGSQQFARDTAAGAADLGTMGLAVRSDAGGSSVGTDGDYTPTQVDANGASRVGGSGPTHLGKAEDVLAADGDVGVPSYLVRRNVPAANAGVGDYMPSIGDGAGATWIRERKPDTVPLGTSVTVGVAQISLIAANAQRFTVTFVNNSVNTIYVGPTGVLVANGLPILRGASVTLEATIEWFGISGAAGNDVRVLEQGY